MSEYIGYEKESPFSFIDGSHPKYAVLTGEEIVRCRDCIYCIDERICSNPKWGLSNNSVRQWVGPSGYCAWGEKR